MVPYLEASMTILPPAVLTTAQLVGGLVASAKNAVDLAKASTDHALKSAVSELYDSLLDVKARVLDLDEAVRGLREELARKDEIEGPDEANGYFFIKSRPEQPLCPKCYQSTPSSTVFLSPIRNVNDGNMRLCTVCAYKHWETPAKPRTIRMIPMGFGRS
jgi:hypothetical protein